MESRLRGWRERSEHIKNLIQILIKEMQPYSFIPLISVNGTAGAGWEPELQALHLDALNPSLRWDERERE